jgi:hypothetical protein
VDWLSMGWPDPEGDGHGWYCLLALMECPFCGRRWSVCMPHTTEDERERLVEDHLAEHAEEMIGS